MEELYFVSNRVKVKNFLAGLSQNSLDLRVAALDPIKSLTVKQSMTKYIAQFENKSTFAKVIGAGTNRLNAFKVKQKTKLRNDKKQLNEIKNLRSKPKKTLRIT